MDVYVVEAWYDHKYMDVSGMQTIETYMAHIASCLENAKEFCHNHLDYHDGDFEWRIYRREVDRDNCCEIGDGIDLVATISTKETKKYKNFIDSLNEDQKNLLRDMLDDTMHNE